jgi:hypothetical protein
MAEKLGCIEVWWLGVFIAPTTKMAVVKAAVVWRTGQSGAPPDTVRALFTVPVALQATVGVGSRCSTWHTGQSGEL